MVILNLFILLNSSLTYHYRIKYISIDNKKLMYLLNKVLFYFLFIISFFSSIIVVHVHTCKAKEVILLFIPLSADDFSLLVLEWVERVL